MSKFKVGDIVTIRHGLSNEYCSAFRIDAGKKCIIIAPEKMDSITLDNYYYIKILEPTEKALCYRSDYHWHTKEKTLEPLKNKQLTFVFHD
jgi:hypothetical protein